MPFNLLLIENSPSDIRLVRETLADTGEDLALTVAVDGEEAMRQLRNSVPGGPMVRPDLILLDLNLPKKDGRAVLKEIKQDPTLTSIPVVVLTASAAEEDIRSSYESYANCYITKPTDLDSFIRVVENIENFWLTKAQPGAFSK